MNTLIPFDVSVTYRGGIVHVRFSGIITAETWPMACDEVLGHPMFEGCAAVLWEFTDLAEYCESFRYEGVLAAAHHVDQAMQTSDRRGKLAIVSRGDGGFGMGRMFAGVAGTNFPLNVEVFRELEPAEQWLQTPDW